MISDLYSNLTSGLKEIEDPAYSAIRANAYNKYEEIGLPDFKNEEYKYTHVAQKVPPNLHFTSSEQGLDLQSIKNQIPDLENSIRIEFLNGILITDLSDLAAVNDKVTIDTIENTAKDHPEIIYQFLKSYIEKSNDPFIHLNTALSREGIFIHIRENMILEKDIYLIHYTQAGQPGLFTSNRHVYWADKNSSARIAEIFISADQAPYFDIPFTSIHLEEGAALSYHKIQMLGREALHLNNTQIHQKKKSHLHSYTVTLSGGMIRNNLNINLDESFCESNLFGLFYLVGTDHVDNHTVVDHIMPHCYSNEYYKGIMDGHSKGVFNGKIFVRQDAQKTNAYQSNKNILLSENAAINSKPQLEIWADDVRCTHGTSTGKLNNEQLFYLRTRGLSEKAARSLLVYAFANDMIDKMEMEGIKTIIEKKIQERLEQSFH